MTYSARQNQIGNISCFEAFSAYGESVSSSAQADLHCMSQLYHRKGFNLGIELVTKCTLSYSCTCRGALHADGCFSSCEFVETVLGTLQVQRATIIDKQRVPTVWHCQAAAAVCQKTVPFQ